MSLELEMDPLLGDTKTPNVSSNNKNSSEKTPLLPIASKYSHTPSSTPQIYSFLSNSFLSWIPYPVVSTVSYLSSTVSSTSSAIVSQLPTIPISHLSSSLYSYASVPLSYASVPLSYASIPLSYIPSKIIKKRRIRKFRKLLSIYIPLFLVFSIYRYSASGPFLPLSCQIVGLGCPNPQISGFALPEFSGVQRIFEENFKNGLDVGAGVSVYYDNKLVVDLQGGMADVKNGKVYDEDTLQLVFSSTKVMSGIVIARLVEQGHLNYSDKISKYWPEFAQGNKENVTLQDLMVHRAGVGYIDSHQMSLSDLSDLDSLSEILASQPHNFDGQPTKAYHGVSRGWYLNEIVRRVDPRHRTIGRIVAEEIAPEYDIEFYFSVKSKLLHSRVANIYTYPLVRLLAKVLLPSWMISEPLHAVFDKMMNENSVSFKTLVETSPDRSQPQDWNRMEMLQYEGPSYNGVTNSRSMAKLAAVMANGGQSLDADLNKGEGSATSSNYTFLEPQLLSPETYSLITTRLPTTFDQVLQENITSTVGGFGYFRLEGLEDVEFTGWGGSGGSLFLWNQELKVGFGYCMNAFHTALLGDKRSLKMLREVVDVIKKTRN